MNPILRAKIEHAHKTGEPLILTSLEAAELDAYIETVKMFELFEEADKHQA